MGLRPCVLRRLFSTHHRIQVSPLHRTNLIFGSNTNVGKSIVSAGLARASLEGNDTFYIKPLQTGATLDSSFVERYCQTTKTSKHRFNSKSLFQWDTPASPHAVSRIENKPVSDEQVLQALDALLAAITSSQSPSTTFIETAGGVLSPSSSSVDNTLTTKGRHAHDENGWGWSTQADLYQHLLGQTPVILVGDGRLGGISATLTALESLVLRGYDIAALVVVEWPGHDNAAAVREYAARKMAIRSGSGEAVLTTSQSIVTLPPIPSNKQESLDGWFESTHGTFARLNDYLQNTWEGQVADLESMKTVGSNILWWPFTQHGNMDDNTKVTLIDSASGDNFHVLQEKTSDQRFLECVPMFDACASWWTQGMGHGESSLALAAAAAAGRYGHVIFPEVVHAPAVALSQALLGPMGPGHGWADRVFFTDDGSTGMEVAIKMGIKLYHTRMGVADPQNYDWVVCAQADCYHGDTLGVMDVAEPSVFNESQHPWYEPKGIFLETPTLGFEDGLLKLSLPEGLYPPEEAGHVFSSVDQAMDVRARMLTSLFSHYKEIIEMQWLVYEHSGVNRKIGTAILEPILMGAGGMKFVDPLWQRALIDIAKSRSVPVIFDEVATGFYRLGVVSCREILQVDPDIACYAKLLTGGLVPLSVTLATDEVFEAFMGDDKSEALLHGHSYTAHPVGCVSAIHAIETYHKAFKGRERQSDPRKLFDEEMARKMSRLPLVEKCFTMGSILAVTIKVEDGASGYAASSRTVPIVHSLRQEGVFARPLGNVVYIMASPMTSTKTCDKLASILYRTIEDVGKTI